MKATPYSKDSLRASFESSSSESEFLLRRADGKSPEMMGLARQESNDTVMSGSLHSISMESQVHSQIYPHVGLHTVKGEAVRYHKGYH